MENDFDSDWLELRYEADAKARKGMIGKIIKKPEARGPISVLDLGAGTGNNALFLIPELINSGIKNQSWLLIDRDADLLNIARKKLDNTKSDFEDSVIGTDILVADLTENLEKLPFGDADLVVSSALFDLVSKEWIERFMERISKSRVKQVLISLTVDGRIEWSPEHPLDPSISDLFKKDMQRDKGFGPALGKDASEVLKQSLVTSGYDVTEFDTAWRIGPDQKKLQKRYMEDMISAVLNCNDDQESINDWRDHRMALIESGKCQLLVGHTDIYAILK